MQDDKNFDLVLDHVLKNYTEVEPSPELAARIVERAHSEAAPHHHHWRWAIGFALPLSAAATLAFVLTQQWSLPQSPAVVASLPAVPRITEQPALLDPAETRSSAKRRTLRISHAHPALAAPYSSEELAVISFVQQHPKEAVEVIKMQGRAAEPLTVSPLQIQPISIATIQEEN